MRSAAKLLVLGLGLAACHDAAIGVVDADAAVPDASLLPHTPKDKVDVLFMMDDSAGAPKQARFRAAFPQFLQTLDAFATTKAVSYHFGVVTSDLGAPGITCGSSRGAKLQAKGAAAINCAGPTSGNFLVYDQQDPANNNIPAGQDAASTFTCMAAVGDKGCGFEMPLEAVYRALHDPIAENAGFLREDAVLAVILLTDEDDCSVDDPASDLFGPDTSTYGPLTSFRCTRFGISCDGQFPLPTTAPAKYASCQPATAAQGNKLSDMNKYLAFFTQPKSKGGVKLDPRDVVLAAIDAPSAPFGTVPASTPEVCGQGVSSCAVLGPSCANPTDASFFADPAVRINALVGSAARSTIGSACADDAGYKSTLVNFAQQITAAL